ncbi:peptide deformylase [Shewanella sp. UCD-KL12]|uniref:peptide deformylase n=1 Tax=Shewanella sp. UCD-KL12 TaxID=1917163 RepID=UPI00097130A9|nr:peptide deformylase [Shewanella sp. UCD-KL12]
MLAIAQAGEPVLKQQALQVTEFDSTLSQLAKEMLDTMLQADGVGIAAPQVHQSLAMFIIASRPNARYPDAPLIEPSVVINPQIVDRSVAKVSGEEGCLSISTRRFNILRHEWIEVRFQDLSGQAYHQTLSGFLARIFQHEYDHLQGITLFEKYDMQTQSSLNGAVQ